MRALRTGILAGFVVVSGAGAVTAERLPTLAVPSHYDLAFDVDLRHARFEGTEAIRIDLTVPSRRIVLHALDLQFHDVLVLSGGTQQKASVTVDPRNETVALEVGRELGVGPAEIRLRYRGRLNEQLRGFYLSRANGRRYAVTQFEATDARRALAAFDEPAYKATFTIAVTVDRSDTAISNGRLLSDTPGPGAGRHTLKFVETPKMSTYLVAIAVGDFQCLTDDAGAVPIRVCATPDKKALGRTSLDAARQILAFYNRYFSIPYPFGKLDLVAVPDFAAGGMENTAAIFFRETDLLTERAASVSTLKRIWSIVAHEIAHQWFGDLVTMRWWDDLWLNEGFATWMEKRPLAEAKPEWQIAVDEAAETELAINGDSLASTRAIRAPVETPGEIDEAFDSIAYEKGAAIVRMLEGYLGPDALRKGVNAYLERHAYGTATSEAFATTLKESSGKPVDRILSSFVALEGVPLVTYTDTCPGAHAEAAVTQQRFALQTSKPHGPSPVWTIPICTKTADSSIPTCFVLGDAKTMLTPPGKCASWTYLNAGALGYYRVEYPPPMLRALATDGRSQLTAGERLSLLGNEWALVRDGRHSVGDYLTLVTGFSGDQSSAVLREITRHAQFIHDYLTTPDTRPLFEAFIRTLFRPTFSDLKLLAGSGEDDERLALRAAVIELLGGAGNDSEVTSRGREALSRSLAGQLRLEPTSAGAIIPVAARRGDGSLWDALSAAVQHAQSPHEHDRYLYALTQFEEPALVERGLNLTLSSALRTQDVGLYLSRFLSNPATNARAWAFLKQHWAALAPKLSVALVDVRVIEALGSFCEPAGRDDIRSFLAAHKLTATTRTLDQTLERIDRCIATRTRQAPSLTEWLRLRTKF